MTTSQVTRRGDQTFIRLGRHDVPVPGPLASAVAQLVSGGRSYRGVGSPTATIWLFPEHLPDRPITPARLGERLRSIGIYAQASTPRPAAPPRCSISPRNFPPQSSPASSACTRQPPPNGCAKPEATGPATQPS